MSSELIDSENNPLTEKTYSAFHLQAELARKIIDEQIEKDFPGNSFIAEFQNGNQLPSG